MALLGADAAQSMPEGFVDPAEVVPRLVVDRRYAGEHNFVGRPIDGYEAPRCLLTRPAAHALAAVQDDLAASGLGLKVFDCYRPARAVAHFVRWARDPKDVGRKREFYPDISKRDLFRLGYISHRSRHSRGSAVDLTLFDRASGREVDMGTAFDHFGPRSSYADPSITAEQRANRARLRSVMQRHGFSPLPQEWWHFSLRREPFPDTYFDFPICACRSQQPGL
jgi:zinc D-Ala-D-Ala dipeptidase